MLLLSDNPVPRDSRSTHTVAHPRGFVEEAAPTGAEEGSSACLVHFVNQAMVIAFNSVAPSTQGQYRYGWQLYQEFTAEYGVDPFLVQPFQAWYTHGLDKLGLPYPVVAMSAFIFWMLRRVDPVTRKSLQPPTVDKYVYHVRHYLLHSGVSITFLLHPILRGLRSGLIRQHRSTHSTRDSRRQAAPNQLVVILRTQLLQLGTMIGKCMAVAAGLGFIGMHRYGHYLPSTSNHFIRAGDVTFEYVHVDAAGASSIATAPTESIHAIPKDKIVALTYFVPHSKTDQLGTGTYSFVRRLALSELVVLDIVGDLYEWCCIAKPSGFEPLFSWNAGTCFPNKTAFNVAIKKAAVSVGLSPKGMSSHSLRIGGASTMFAGGAHGAEIQHRGDWKSLEFLIYLRTSVAACDKALLTLVNPNAFTVNDALRLSRNKTHHHLP